VHSTPQRGKFFHKFNFLLSYNKYNIITMKFFSQLKDNITRAARPFIRNPAKELVSSGKAITSNLDNLVSQGLKVVDTAIGAGLKSGTPQGIAGASVLVPVAAAGRAVDLTLKGIRQVEDKLAPSINPRRLEEGDFVKQSRAGRLAEQFVRGDISQDVNYSIPPGLRPPQSSEDEINDLVGDTGDRVDKAIRFF
jgi:hypothetical protein